MRKYTPNCEHKYKLMWILKSKSLRPPQIMEKTDRRAEPIRIPMDTTL